METDSPPQHKNSDAMPHAGHPILETVELTKDYPGLRALDSINFQLFSGEVHILFGENGAGKSTLISMISGANTPTSGEIIIDGKPVRLNSVHEARNMGISAVFQEFSLIPQMTVTENIFLGAEKTQKGILKKNFLRKEAKRVINELEFNLNPNAKVEHLTRAEQQMVEIAKAFRSELSILILDEPTASLTNHEVDQLFRLVDRLKSQGVGIVYITHRIDEIKRIGDRITVLRDGKFIATVDSKKTSEDELVQLMTGRDVGQIFPTVDFEAGEVLLQTNNMSTKEGSVCQSSVVVRQNEIVGLAGLVGSGKSKFAQTCFGLREVSSGSVYFKGQDVTNCSVREMLDKGVLYLPADRSTDGLMMMANARKNISLSALNTKPFSNGLFLDKRSESKIVYELAKQLNLSPRRVEQLTEHFSGGNQQKIMLARSLTKRFDLIVLDEPTVGVDVGTRAAIYEFIVGLCKQGTGILLISSDLPEVLNMCTRIYVFYQSKVQVELKGKDITETNVLRHFFGQKAA